MDDGDEYIPQISQMEYMLDSGGPGSMSNGSQQYNCTGGMNAMNYYETNDSNALNAMQQMTNIYGTTQQQPQGTQQPNNLYMTPQQQMMYQQQVVAQQMRPPLPPQQSQQPVKPKRQRKNKKAEAAEAAAAEAAAAAAAAAQQQQQRYGSGYMQHPSMIPMRPPSTNPYDYNQQGWQPNYPSQTTPQNYRPPIQPPNGYGQPSTNYPPTNQPPNPYYQQQIRPPYYPQQNIPTQNYQQQNPQQQPSRYPTTPTPTQNSQQQTNSQTNYGGYMDMNGYGYPQQPSSSANYPKQNPPLPQQQTIPPNGYGQSTAYPPTNQNIPTRPPYMPPTHGPNGQPYYHPQQIQMEIIESERQLQMLYNQPKTPEIIQRIEYFNQKLLHFRKWLPQPPPQQISTGYQQSSMVSPNQPSQIQHYPPPMSQELSKPPLSQNSVPDTPVPVMQSNANQVQVNITPEQTNRTLISVYNYPQPESTASTSSNYSKDGIPQEPIPSTHQQQTNHVLPPQQYGNYSNNNQKQNFIGQPEIFDPQQIKNVDQMLAGTSELIIAEENYPEEHKIERIENINITRNHENNIGNDYKQISQPIQQQQQPLNENVVYNEMKNDIQDEEECNLNGGRDIQEESNQSIDEYDFKPPHAPAPREISEEDDSNMNFQDDEEERKSETSEKNLEEEKIDENLKIEEENEIIDEEGPLSPPSTPQKNIHEKSISYPPIENEKNKNEESEPIETIEILQQSTTFVPILMEPASESSSFGNTPNSNLNIPSEATYETTPAPENYNEEDSNVGEDQPSVSISQDGNEEYLPIETGKKKGNRAPPKPRVRKPPQPKKTLTKSRKRKKDSDFDDDEDEDFAISAKSARKQKKIAQAIAAAAAEITEAEQAAGFQASDLIEKRRSVRRKIEDKSYADESLMEFEVPIQEDLNNKNDFVEEEKPWTKYENVWLVEKILAMRKEERPVKSEKNNEKEEKTDEKEEKNDEKEEKNDVKDNGESSAPKETSMPKMELVDTFLVKYKHKSYRHCSWKTAEELSEYDPKITPRCNRFRQKNEYLDEDADEVFNEDFLIPSRVVDIEYDDDGNEYCYIKWCALSYDEATWENGNDKSFEDLKISYHLWNDEIDPIKTKSPSRPGPEYFKPITLDKKYKGENELREYQVEGVNWLLYCYFERNNCILADEMGLGKTVQTITLLQGIYDTGIHGPFLVVVPLSTLHNWEREFQTWTDINAIVYHGQSKSRDIIQNNEFYYKQSRKKIVKFDVIITTFEMVVTDCEVLKRFNYRVCVIDEAHRLKNKNCKLLTSGLSNFKVEHRVLLTGTPLQNNITELYSLLNFLDSTKFGSQEEFLEQFGNCQTEEQVNALQGMLKPMMLRRLKEDVEKTLQPKEETIIEVQLSNIQKKYYRAILERNFTHLLKSSHMPSMMNTMMELRKCCNHPYLIKGAEDQILQEVREMYPEKSQHDQVTTGLIQASGKLVLIDKLLPKLRQDGHKVLIFSQMVKVLDILEEFLGIKNFTYERIDGNVRGDLRQAAIDRFSKPDSDKFVFLLCTRAGGLGINLTAADTVIIFDSDWNPQNDLQAQARCHRIGQTKMVKVYRLITANTYEREMFDRASLKLGLDKAVLQSMAPKEQNAPLSKKEVEDLLKKGAYGAVMDEDNEGSKFSEEDIETILQRRTQTITIEPGIKGSKFAKASFKSTNNEDIDVDDPNFWQKWANKAQIEIKEKNAELILEEPRSRRKRFDQQQDNSNDDENSDDENKRSRDRSQNDLRNRSGKKRRRLDDDDDEYYGTAAPPDELIFNKSEYFKLEKFILQYGWGRWDAIAIGFESEKNEKEAEHMTRTLLLHCLREFRGDERTRDYVWNLIIPPSKDDKQPTTSKKTATMFTDGWASKPEYNPPGFALDTAFHRHIYRHTNKLVTRVHHLHILETNIITEKWTNKCKDVTIDYKEIDLTTPTVNDPIIPGWEKDDDKCLIIGIYRHGAENYDAINKDEKLTFHDKPSESLPTPMELNNRFKRIIQLELRKSEVAAQNNIQFKVQIQNQVATRGTWTEKEEKDFLKTLINFGVWDYSSGDKINIKWHKFRDFTPSLMKKTDGQMIENLYCILARCSSSMGTELSEIDNYRAKQIIDLPKKVCTIVMQRLTLMRKIHINFMTKDDEVRKIHIRMMPLEKMPNGWTHEHDEKMFQLADGCGISWFKTKLSKLPEFTKIKLPSEQILFRRLFEIVATVDAGRYVGEHEQMVFEFEDEEPTEEDMLLFIVSAMFVDKDKNGQAAQSALHLLAAAASQQPSSSNTISTSTSENVGTSRRSQAKKKTVPTSSTKKEAKTLMSSSDQAALQNYMALLAATTATQGSKANEVIQLQQQLGALMQLSQLSSTAAMAQNNALTVKALEDALNLSKKESTSKASSSRIGTLPFPTSDEFDKMISQQLGMSLQEMQLLQSLDASSRISMYDPESKNRITGDKAPTLTQLESWMKLNPKYRVDFTTTFATTQKKLTAALSGIASSSSTSKVNGNINDNNVSGTSTPTPSTSAIEHSLEPGEIPKASTSKSTDYDNITIGLYSKTSGTTLAKEKWPTLKNLQNFLDKNQDYNVQGHYTSIVKNVLSKSHQNRIGGDEAIAALQAMMINPNAAAYLLNTGSTNNANSNASASLAQQAALEAVQLQLAMAMYGPYAAMGLSGLGTGLTAGSGLTGANLNQFGSTNTTKSSTNTSKTSATTSSSGKNASATTSSTASTTDATNNVASQMLQGSAISAELYNSALAQFLTIPAVNSTVPSTSTSTTNPLAGYNLSDPNVVQQMQAFNVLQMLMTNQTTNSSTKPSTSSTTEKKSSGGSSTPTISGSKKSLGKIVEDLAKSSS